MKLFNFLLVLTCFVTYAQTPYFENDTIALSEVVITAQKKAMKITPHKTVLDLSNKAVFSPKLLSAIQIDGLSIFPLRACMPISKVSLPTTSSQ